MECMPGYALETGETLPSWTCRCRAWVFHCLSLTFRCLSLGYCCLSLIFHCLSMPFFLFFTVFSLRLGAIPCHVGNNIPQKHKGMNQPSSGCNNKRRYSIPVSGFRSGSEGQDTS